MLLDLSPAVTAVLDVATDDPERVHALDPGVGPKMTWRGSDNSRAAGYRPSSAGGRFTYVLH